MPWSVSSVDGVVVGDVDTDTATDADDFDEALLELEHAATMTVNTKIANPRVVMRGWCALRAGRTSAEWERLQA